MNNIRSEWPGSSECTYTMERKYHKCVLQFCPFFECLLRNDFLEIYTGTIHLKRGTPSNVDMALMYLYGKEPILNDDNIVALIDLAEFFMIPNLKSACVKWLESTTVSEENCMHLLHLSSLYDFDIPNCTNYFSSHLEEMLSHETALHLTCDSVNYILTEETFSYLRMEDRLRFLARWYKTQPKYRFLWVKKFLKMLTFEEIPSTIVNELKIDLVFGKLLSGISAGTFNPEEIIPVHIFFEWPYALCFDMEQSRWFKIDLCATGHVVFGSENIINTDPNSPVVYLEDNQSDECKVIAYNLETGVKKEYKMDYKVETEINGDATRLKKYHFCRNMCAGYDTKLVKPNISVANACNEGTMDLVSEDIDRDGFDLLYNAMSPCEDSLIINTVFIRYDESDVDIIKMMPKFSLKGTRILLLAMNPLSEVAIVLTNSDHILIYDNISCSMTKLEAETNYMDQIFSTEGGFVIHDDTRCICITRLSGQELSQQYEIKTISLNSNHLAKNHFFCSNTWFRLIFETHCSGVQFQCVKHDLLLAATTADDIEWKKLPIPMKSSEYLLPTFVRKIYRVGLPRRMLRCHPECPHCDAKERESSTYTFTRSVYSDSDSDEYDSDDYSVNLG